MPASSGGDGYRDDGRSPIRTLRERADAVGNGGRIEPRPLSEILPNPVEAGRSRDMQATWQAFCLERYDMVRGVLDSRRSPPEIAYQLGELIHTYFRPRGLTLTSQELRRLVAELLDPSRRGSGAQSGQTPIASRPEEKADGPSEAANQPKKEIDAPPSGLVSFRDVPETRQGTWTGDEDRVSPRVIAEAAFEPPASPLVSIGVAPELGFDRLLARTLELARTRLGGGGKATEREEAVRAIDAAMDEAARTEQAAMPSAETRRRVLLVALSEICGLGLIDRLWSDRSVRAVFVNGPKSVFVERQDGLAPASEVFRDQDHLARLVARLAEPPASGIAQFQLRDGSSGTIVFPPAAPDGPVLVLRRAEPGSATVSRLIAADVLDAQVAALLRIAMRAGLKILIQGEAGTGKTSLLAALGRDLDSTRRLVTIAPHRAFRWNAAAKVELVASRQTSYGALLAAAMTLRPQMLLLDSVSRAEVETVCGLVARAAHGLLVACEASVPTAELSSVVDVRVRLGRGRDGVFRVLAVEDAAGAAVFVHEDGHFHCRTRDPAFGGKLRAAGFDKEVTALLG
ncbi:Pilus assembly protein, ATPase of CpaF family [Enhydrobacter aerosaccus]|uniref:Pilus assembly protein, ATPase of CpaF family n=1 Tax=Enhydrobacter aerosaccus TaxID=225324 RepID=A0A1T4JNX1_9HYPH|nr:ATPase, T2SS/T4P/T4SS family [Enhydrobacter aerosaccus]SJZ31841.1 Pilus assembly protein, ATPase of CpaF family [Enhydrobacter aerosaccus]